MLKAISLYTIKQIFEIEATAPISAMAKMSYISCLMYYFEDMPLDLESTNTFDIVKAQIKSWGTTQKYFNEMQAAGLVRINHETITFFNHWRKHIDKEILTKPSPEQYLNKTESKSAKDFREELGANKNMFELIQMRHKFSYSKMIELIDEFVKEKEATKERYLNDARCAKHFISWVNKKAPHIPKTNPGNSGKILGR